MPSWVLSDSLMECISIQYLVSAPNGLADLNGGSAGSRNWLMPATDKLQWGKETGLVGKSGVKKNCVWKVEEQGGHDVAHRMPS